MFRVSGEVEYNHSVIPASLCGQLRPSATLCATLCHPVPPLQGDPGVEEDYKEVSQHCFLSGIEI